MSEFSSGVPDLIELVKQHHALHEFVLERYRTYLDAVYTNSRYDTRGYAVDSWLADADGDMLFQCSDSEGETFELIVSLGVRDLFSMPDDEFDAMLPRLKREHQTWIQKRVEADAAAAEAAKSKRERELQARAQRERDRIFREEAKRRGIEVPS